MKDVIKLILQIIALATRVFIGARDQREKNREMAESAAGRIKAFRDAMAKGDMDTASRLHSDMLDRLPKTDKGGAGP